MTYTKAFYWAQSVKEAMANGRLAAIRMFRTYNDTDNPHPHGTDEYDAWKAGYNFEWKRCISHRGPGVNSRGG
jgi:hypothetical protein